MAIGGRAQRRAIFGRLFEKSLLYEGWRGPRSAYCTAANVWGLEFLRFSRFMEADGLSVWAAGSTVHIKDVST